MKLFKSKEHQIGYNNLKQDYELLEAASNALVTRLTEKNWDNLVERFWDEIQNCVEDEWVENPRVQARIDNHEMAGSLESLIAIIDFYEWAGRIPHYLYEAYEGYYEDEMARDLEKPMEEPEDTREWIIEKIHGHTPREQLKVYLEWNGILGWQHCIENILLDFPLTKN